MSDADLVARIAQILRQEIGPAIDAEYPKTQAFMAGVILERLGRQLALADEHAAADSADRTALLADLGRLVGTNAPAPVREAMQDLTRARDTAAVCRLIDALYATRPEFGEAQFAAVLGRLRSAMRRSIDRRMAVAG